MGTYEEEIGTKLDAKELGKIIEDHLDMMELGFTTNSTPVEAEGENGFIMTTDDGREFVVVIRENTNPKTTK